MFKKTPCLVVAIKTSDADALRVSVPPLRRFRHKFMLVIYNDNVDVKLDVHTVRNLGWHGRLKIINSEKNLGELESRMSMVECIKDSKINADWILLLNDGDVLIDASLPDVSDDVFAIIKNATTLCDSHIDMFRINSGWVNGTSCGKTGPHFEINGTAVRAQIMFEFIEFLRSIVAQVKKMLRDNKRTISCDTAMWEMLNGMMHRFHPNMSPIYMNKTNYVLIKLGQKNTSAGRSIAARMARQRFAKLVEIVGTQNMVAENQ